VSARDLLANATPIRISERVDQDETCEYEALLDIAEAACADLAVYEKAPRGKFTTEDELRDALARLDAIRETK
jgi:hypothetical protein